MSTDLKTLNYPFRGIPFMAYAASSTLTLDAVCCGTPFVYWDGATAATPPTPPARAATFLDTYIDITPAGTSGWQAVSLSAYVPVNGIALILSNPEGTGNLGARMTGSTDNRTADGEWSHRNPIVIGVGASQSVDLYRIGAGQVYYLMGYLPSTMGTMLTNAVDYFIDMSVSGWQLVDCSGDVPAGDGVAAIFEYSGTGAASNFSFRTYGSTDSEISNSRSGHQWCVVPLDSSGRCELQTPADVHLYLCGYLTTVHRYASRVEVSLGIIGTYGDVDLNILDSNLPYNAEAVLLEVTGASSTPYAQDMRKKGVTDENYVQIYGSSCQYPIIGLDSAKLFEGKIGQLNANWYVLGYLLTPTAPASTGNKRLLNGFESPLLKGAMVR